MATEASGRRIEDTGGSASVSAEGALLWVLHSLLRAHWGSACVQPQLPPLELRAFAGNVSLLPAIVYPLSKQHQQQQQRVEAGETQQSGAEDTVEVRTIKVPQKLFVHFVSTTASVRLALVVGEYVKPVTGNATSKISSGACTASNGRVLRVGKWLCNQELLRWRLERNVFPEFSSEPPALHTMGAELSKLSEPTLTHIYEFLCAAEFIRVTQTSKTATSEPRSKALGVLTRGFCHVSSSDFPESVSCPSSAPATEKRQYIDQYEKKLRRDRARQAMIRLAMLWEDSVVRDGRPLVPEGRGGFVPFSPPVQPSLWLPPSPFHPLLPGEMLNPEGRRRRGRDSDLDFNAELRPAFDQRRREFIERWCRAMRWGERGPAVLNGSSRDEADVAGAFQFAPRLHSRAALLVLKKPGPKPTLTGTTFDRNVRPVKGVNMTPPEVAATCSSSSGSRAEVDPVVAPVNGSSSALPWPQVPSSFLVCSEKSVRSNNNDDEHSEESSETSWLHHEKRASVPNSSDLPKKAAPHSLQRSDSELELIISELREKISLQHRLEEEKRKLAIATANARSSESGTGALDSSRSTGSNSEHHNHHPRRHLKNPVERVHGSDPQGAVGVPMLPSSSSNLLKRQQSASHMSRQQATGNAARLAPPTVTATIISASAVPRSDLMASASGVGNLHNGSIYQDRSDLDGSSYTRVFDGEGMLIKSYAQEPNNITAGSNNRHGSYPASHLHSSTATNGVQRPIVYYGSTDPTQRRPRRIRRATPEIERRSFKLNLEPQNQQQQQSENNASDSDSSYFGEDENPFLL